MFSSPSSALSSALLFSLLPPFSYSFCLSLLIKSLWRFCPALSCLQSSLPSFSSSSSSLSVLVFCPVSGLLSLWLVASSASFFSFLSSTSPSPAAASLCLLHLVISLIETCQLSIVNYRGKLTSGPLSLPHFVLGYVLCCGRCLLLLLLLLRTHQTKTDWLTTTTTTTTTSTTIAANCCHFLLFSCHHPPPPLPPLTPNYPINAN